MPVRTLSRPRRRRLQRDKDFTGERLTSFRQVFLRHGLPGLLAAIGLLLLPGLYGVFAESLSAMAVQPTRYVIGGMVILVTLSLYTWRLDRQWRPAQLAWIAYLGALSLWEEWVFRLALPHLIEASGASVWLAALMSAILFGALHYFTLRWRWQWCVSAALGGLYFSYQMELHGNLLLVAGIHWVATSINTPRPPSPPSPGSADL